MPPRDDAEEARLRAAVRAELTEHREQYCRMPLTGPEIAQATHYLGMVQDLGGGSLAAGIEVMRKNHEWLAGLRQSSSRAGWIIAGLVITSVVAGALSALWLGIQHLIHIPGVKP